MSDADNERRAYPRVPVDLWVDEHHESATYYQHAANLSEGGMFLPGTIGHEIGTRVRLEFRLPGDDTLLSIHAVVVGATAPDDATDSLGMRLRFVEPDSDATARIQRFLAQAAR